MVQAPMSSSPLKRPAPLVVPDLKVNMHNDGPYTARLPLCRDIALPTSSGKVRYRVYMT